MYNINDTHKKPRQENILLTVLPYWDPLIPPRGIAHLKTFLQHHGYPVVTKDANTENTFKRLYDEYFNCLKANIHPEKRGNFYNNGHDVLRNQMMAHINYTDWNQYIDLIKQVVYNTYFAEINDAQVQTLDDIMSKFYVHLKAYTLDLLSKTKPSVLGISVFRDSLASSLFMFRLVKEMHPEIFTIMGGSVFADILSFDTPNFKYFSDNTPYIDKIIIGEGQNLFLKLLKGEFPEQQRVFTLNDIGGETLGFSALNTPDVSDFDVQNDYPYLSAQSSVSCPFQCSFCNVNSLFGEYRKKETKQTVEEMVSLYKQYGMQLFFMCDSLLNYTASDLSNELIRSGIQLYWDCYMKVDNNVCDIEKTSLWRQGGCYRVRLGIESGSQRVLELMNKKIVPDQIRSALFSLANAGIKTTTYWVIGFPGETEEDFQQTLSLLEKLKNYIYESECNAFQYIYSGQNKKDDWPTARMTLYPETAQKMLMTQTWVLDLAPSREEIYNRVCRFARHCEKLGIPNPYSIYDIYHADERWQRLHKNAVPNLVEFKEQGNYVNDTGTLEETYVMETVLGDDDDFGF